MANTYAILAMLGYGINKPRLKTVTLCELEMEVQNNENSAVLFYF